MTNPPYYVDLFYEDVGFTNDYSNVLQFDSKEDREEYFDEIAHTRIENVQFNNINIQGNSIKVAFYNLQSVDLDKYNYIRIATRLLGSSLAESQNVIEYGFIIDYEVVSSNENCTVVNFTFEKDIWTNYQFNFKLRECNVERSHMDRWDENGKMIYTRPSGDALQSYMKVNKSKDFENKWLLISLDAENSQLDNLKIKNIEDEIALCVVTVSHKLTQQSPDSMYIAYFPVCMSGNFLVKEFSNGKLTIYPTMQSVLEGNLFSAMNWASSSIIDVQILFNANINMTTSEVPETIDPSITYKCEITHNIEPNVLEYAFGVGNIKVQMYYIDTNKNFVNGDAFYVPWNNNGYFTTDLSIPEKPNNGADYNTKYEPMLYKDPVMQRYVTNCNGDELYQIPDIKLDKADKIYYKTFISAGSVFNYISTEQDVDISSERLISNVGQITAFGCDVLNSYWQEYVITQRNSDRQMMWANILTGGIAESGSTAVSAGIGYRSNEERARLAELEATSALTGTFYHDKLTTEANMYRSMAKSAMMMSGVGGIAAFSANALGTGISQMSKEQAIKNKPANLTKAGNWFGQLTSKNYRDKYVELKCDESSFNEYANIFKKFGYYIGGVIEPDIKSRKYFNYIKTNGAILTGNVNQSILSNLATLFDKGMTIWHMDYTTKATLYKYDKENIERSLITNE